MIPRSNLKEFSQDEIREIIHKKLREQTYSEEEADNILNGIKQICFSFIYDDKIPDMQRQDVQNALNFLGERYDFLNKMKNALELKHYSWPLTEFAQSVDEYMLSEDKESYVHERVYGKLSKDVTSALDQVSFCYGIMLKIKKYYRD